MGTHTLIARGASMAKASTKCALPYIKSATATRIAKTTTLGNVTVRYASATAAAADVKQATRKAARSTARSAEAQASRDLTRNRHVTESHVALQGVRLGYSRKGEEQQVLVSSHPPMKVYNLQTQVLTHTLVKQLRTELRANNLDTDGTRVIVLRQEPANKGPTLLESEHSISKTNSLALRNQFELCDDLLHSRPVFAVIEGHVTDAGAAVAASCYHRVATNNSSFQARSQNSGLVHGGMLPLLASLDNYMAEYLVLTGATLHGQDLFTSGLSTVYVPYERLELLYQRLPMLLSISPDTIQAVLCEFAEAGPADGTLDFKKMEMIKSVFHSRHTTIHEVMESLKKVTRSREIMEARMPTMIDEETLMSEVHNSHEQFAINTYNQIRHNLLDPQVEKELEITLRMIREARQLSMQSRLKYFFRLQTNVKKMGLNREFADYRRPLPAEHELCLPVHAALEQKMAKVARTIDDVAEDAILKHLNKFGDRYGGEQSGFATKFLKDSLGERAYASIPANMRPKREPVGQTGFVDETGAIHVEQPAVGGTEADSKHPKDTSTVELNEQGEPLVTYELTESGALEVRDHGTQDDITIEISDMEDSADEGAATAAPYGHEVDIPLYRKDDGPADESDKSEGMLMDEINVFHTPGAKGVITHSEFWHAVSMVKRRKKNKYGLGFCSQFDILRRLSHRLQIPGNRAQLDSLFSVDDRRLQHEKVLYSVDREERANMLKKQVEEEQHLLNQSRQQIVDIKRNKLKAKRKRYLDRKKAQ
ncbi:hypothetical protein SARC_05456 [Sphaeroforma arctica JP610]|uniref:3-hydroxyisobutyryl-CoA hydrolase n=1 Tax=Sphaeroforma arctica JP610 TaxID=667725 RepID=A0A0L0G070_9EUKA|nr:hypothetical protein SARC_05456 [Sphaeroforma arctica JP610]KNC82249.1 hypothetical protein SARC_05456 [Sphaeroforma arctica JP610]|eukprot:XP_014156151.1 hypothetical protein SARC_05456 [Sphaeroforma arctica JP610]